MTDAEQERQSQQSEEDRESGMPGGGKGRRDVLSGHSGVYPASGPLPPGDDAEIQGMASWGQGERGAAGYEDHGGSELTEYAGEKALGGLTAGPSGEAQGEPWDQLDIPPEEFEPNGEESS